MKQLFAADAEADIFGGCIGFSRNKKKMMSASVNQPPQESQALKAGYAGMMYIKPQ